MACFVAPATAVFLVNAAKKKFPGYHIEWLLALLWGGVAWLIPEHIYHGEVVLYPPFFTAGLTKIVPEVIRVGIPMVIGVFVVWFILLGIRSRVEKFRTVPATAGLMISGAVLMVAIDILIK